MNRHLPQKRVSPRFPLTPMPDPAGLASARRSAAEVRRLKAKLAAKWTAVRPGDAHRFRLALNEAEALAWQTPFPTLFFPALAREKAQHLLAWQERQAALRRRTAVISFAA